MLSEDVDRYITLRRTLGYKLVKAERHFVPSRASLPVGTKRISAPPFSPGWRQSPGRRARTRAAPNGPVRALPACRRSSA